MRFNGIFQDSLPITPWADPQLGRLPGIAPLDPTDWNLVDEAFAKQLAYVEHLFDKQHDDVFEILDGAQGACDEVLQMALDQIGGQQGYHVDGPIVQRPDRAKVDINAYHPLEAARRLMQQDLCLMGPSDGEHVLQAAALCFPANWRLSEKIGRPLVTIHEPVTEYTPDIGKRVQRLFDMIKAGHPMYRANWLMYAEGDLHQPKRFTQIADVSFDRFFMRVERQAMTYLPDSGYTLFGIHSYVVRSEDLTEEQMDSLRVAVMAKEDVS